MPVEHLERYIISIRKIGYRFVSLLEILRDDVSGKVLALTVDDAYKACITNLLPILKKYRIQSTLFVPPGLIGLPANHVKLLKQNCYPDEAMMNLEDLKLWKQEGQQIGFHTYNHINLKCLTQEDIEYDFHMGLEKLQEWGMQTEVFAYPFGYLPDNFQIIEKELLAYGFKYAFTVKWGDVNIDTPYYINRVCIGDREPLVWSILKTIGWVDWYPKIKCLI